MRDCIILPWDCRRTLAAIRSESVDLVISSPPYGMDRKYGDTREKRQSLEDYLEEMRPVLNELLCRILKPTGSLCWQVGNYVEDDEIFPLDIQFYNALKQHNGLKLRNRIIWRFEHGLAASKRLSGRYETILWFTKSDNYVFNLDPIRVPQKYPGKTHFKGLNYGLPSSNPLGKNPSDYWDLGLIEQDWEELVWNVPNVKNNHVEKTSHPCQFPVELVQRLVLALTNEGDTILDPYAGVGSSAIAALTLNRKAVLCEIEPEYIEITKQRLTDLQNGTLKIRPPVPVHQPGPMIHFENARRELELARTVDEVKQIRDKAEAMRLYCKQALHSLEMQNQCAEIKLRAERRAGEMLSETEKNPGGQVEHESYLSHDGTGRIPKLSELGITRNQSSRWQKISEIPEESFEEFIETTKSKEAELTSHGALLLARDIERQRKIQEIEQEIEKPSPMPEGTFHVIVVDPPWHYHLRTGQASKRNVTPYPTMSLAEIKEIPVVELAAENSILWLWSTNAHLPDAFEIVETWGFQYKTFLTWIKPRIGTGDWLRGRTEHCIMAVKGHPLVRLTNQSTALHAPVRDHSQKPDEFYRLVETLCPGRKIELFSRETRDGWDTWLSQAGISQTVGL